MSNPNAGAMTAIAEVEQQTTLELTAEIPAERLLNAEPLIFTSQIFGRVISTLYINPLRALTTSKLLNSESGISNW